MTSAAVARRYARALFSLAKSEAALESVGTSLGVVTDALIAPNAMRVLTGPIKKERKREIIAKVADAVGAPTPVRNFLHILVEHQRLDHLEQIRAVFDGLLDRERGITRAVIRSATDLSGDIREQIGRTFSAITGRTVVARVDVDPSLIAGVIVEVDGRVYDGSLRTELGKIRQQMATGS